MIGTLKLGFQVALFMLVVVSIYYAFINSYNLMLKGQALIVCLAIVYHLLFDRRNSSLFLRVFALFAISCLASVYLPYVGLERDAVQRAYFLFVELPWFIGLSFIFFRLLSDNVMQFDLKKKSFLVLLVIAIDVFFAYQIMEMISKYNLGVSHIIYSFTGIIVRMILLSVGLVFYLSSESHYRKTSLLFGSFLCFFLCTIISSLNSLIFYADPVPALNILEITFLYIAMVFFYMYCRTPSFVKELEQERFF